jgi:hypothetical protein
LHAVLITPEQATSRNLKKCSHDGYNAAVLYLEDRNSEEDNQKAVDHIKSSGLNLYYWIEVARSPVLADAHPEWMSSIQGTAGWRKRFPKVPQPSEGQVVKTYPWVPLLYRETFDLHRQRIEVLLEDLPQPRGIFLNDLQSGPSACGCGNSFCRWTTDNGPIRTATPLPPDAAAQFVAIVQRIMPKAEVIPVWTTECAEQDGPKGAACDGAGCFENVCWKEYVAQLVPVAGKATHLGVLLPFNDFEPSLSRSGSNGEWQQTALKSFTDVLPSKGAPAIPQDRLIAVLQGWDLKEQQVQTQVQRARQSGAYGDIVALTRIDQSWEPRVISVPPASKK